MLKYLIKFSLPHVTKVDNKICEIFLIKIKTPAQLLKNSKLFCMFAGKHRVLHDALRSTATSLFFVK